MTIGEFRECFLLSLMFKNSEKQKNKDFCFHPLNVFNPLFQLSAQVNVVLSNIASVANTLVLLPFTVRSFKYSEFGYQAILFLFQK